jgi:DNA mismatch repair ATPase MutL
LQTWDDIEHKKFKPISQNQRQQNTLFPNHATERASAFSKDPHQNKEIPFPVSSPKPFFFKPERLTDKKEIIAEEQYPYLPSRHSDNQISGTPHHDGPEMQKKHYPSTETQTPLAVIGQLHNTYIVCESENELILFDQHAAHERILFEHLKRKSKITGSLAQKLLIPEIIDLGYQESITLEKLIPGLLHYGLEIEPFGGTAFAVKTIPSLISDKEVKPFIMEMVESITDIGFSDGIEKILDECLILMACHGSIRANQALSLKEMTGLIDQLASCENPSHCPHGRPTRISWPIVELEKKFKRIL